MSYISQAGFELTMYSKMTSDPLASTSTELGYKCAPPHTVYMVLGTKSRVCTRWASTPPTELHLQSMDCLKHEHIPIQAENPRQKHTLAGQ